MNTISNNLFRTGFWQIKQSLTGHKTTYVCGTRTEISSYHSEISLFLSLSSKILLVVNKLEKCSSITSFSHCQMTMSLISLVIQYHTLDIPKRFYVKTWQISFRKAIHYPVRISRTFQQLETRKLEKQFEMAMTRIEREPCTTSVDGFMAGEFTPPRQLCAIAKLLYFRRSQSTW